MHVLEFVVHSSVSAYTTLPPSRIEQLKIKFHVRTDQVEDGCVLTSLVVGELEVVPSTWVIQEQKENKCLRLNR